MRTPQPDQVVLVTGSSGLIGARTADHLAADFRVVGLDRPGVPHPPPSADNIPFDLTSDQSVTEGLIAVRDRYGPG